MVKAEKRMTYIESCRNEVPASSSLEPAAEARTVSLYPET